MLLSIRLRHAKWDVVWRTPHKPQAPAGSGEEKSIWGKGAGAAAYPVVVQPSTLTPGACTPACKHPQQQKYRSYASDASGALNGVRQMGQIWRTLHMASGIRLKRRRGFGHTLQTPAGLRSYASSAGEASGIRFRRQRGLSRHCVRQMGQIAVWRTLLDPDRATGIRLKRRRADTRVLTSPPGACTLVCKHPWPEAGQTRVGSIAPSDSNLWTWVPGPQVGRRLE